MKNYLIILALWLCAAFAVMLLSSCNLTRTTTTTAQHYVSGDTTTTIITKTIESYDGSVKPKNILNY